MHKTPHHIGAVLKQIRLQALLTAEEVARRTGFTPSDVADFLSGNSCPSRLFISRFAQISGTDPQLLLNVWQDERERHLKQSLLIPRHRVDFCTNIRNPR
ncbi:helix-turn-helix domain-containing protein [Streptomyces sp. NPDC050161]|uniref:helix-turn-helix domain-containing protein n=1 Tax=Streptomyces sp. NPDC050161 TaxID=3365604 RepID=UPI00378CB7B1